MTNPGKYEREKKENIGPGIQNYLKTSTLTLKHQLMMEQIKTLDPSHTVQKILNTRFSS